MVLPARISLGASTGHRPMMPLSSSLGGSWSVLDTERSVETARQRSEVQGVKDRRVDLVVKVLGQYKIEVAALQETKCFGTAVYRVGGSVVLAAGRPTPEPDQPKQRQGVALVLSGSAVNLWKEDGGLGVRGWLQQGSRSVFRGRGREEGPHSYMSSPAMHLF